MDVEFRISWGYDDGVGEGELGGLPAERLAELAARSWFNGVLVLSHGGQPSVRVKDEIEPQIQNLCYGAVPGILAGEPQEIRYFDKAAGLWLRPEGDVVHVSGDLVPAAVFPRRDLALALFDCGDRFVRWTRALMNGEERGGVVSALEYRPAAHSALRAAGLTPSEPD